MSLRKLVDRLGGESEFLKYSSPGSFPLFVNSKPLPCSGKAGEYKITGRNILISAEAEELISLSDQVGQVILVGTFPEDMKSRMSYTAKSILEMVRDIGDLRLPNYSENKGEQLFRATVRMIQNVEGRRLPHFQFELPLDCGSMLELVLQRQLYVWINKKPVDDGFYLAQKGLN